uniref:Cytochrome P450 3635A3 short isoform n=1 Tax=Maconellicoccus hirsutus TaxID=177089 RepID=A0AAT9UTL3_MACHI
MYVVVFLSSVILLLYFILRHKLRYWERRGVPCIRQNFLSSELDWLIKDKSRFQYFKDIYDELAPHKYGGYSVMPLKIMIRDPEYIKYVLTKEYDSFSSREKLFFTKTDPLTHFIFNLEGKEWKDTRAKLTPGFSSGKLKHMFELISECASEMDQTINITAEKTIDVTKFLRLYVMNVIFTCTYGLKVNKMENGCEIFLKMAGLIRGGSNFSKKLANFFFILPSAIRHYVTSSAYGTYSRDFFKKIVLDCIRHREENHILRNDFLQIFMTLMNADDETKWTIDKTLAHGILYIMAGFSTTTSAISFLLYEMAKHPHMQEKLLQEIDQAFQESDGNLDYDTVQKPVYLNKIISETMRKYCIIGSFSRRCTTTCALPDGFVIEKGTAVVVSTSGLHHDPQYYPNPLKFDPERFNEENKNARHPYVYMPFGAGPRYCIGERFSILMIKAATMTVLKKFSVSILPENDFEFIFMPNKLTTEVEKINLQFKPRENMKKNLLII